MANQTFATVIPPLLAIANRDGSYSVGVGEAFEWIERLLGDDRPLTTTGVQYNVTDGAAVGTTIQNTETDLYTFTLDNKGREAYIDYMLFGLTIALIQVTGAVNGIYRWYWNDLDAGGWQEIYESPAIALPAAYDEVGGTVSGYWRPGTDLKYPITMKLTLETDGAVNMGKAKVKNSCYVLIKAR